MSMRHGLCLTAGIALFVGMILPTPCVPVAAADTASALAAIRNVGPEGIGHESAAAAVSSLSKLDAGTLPQVLEAMDNANPLAKNWLFGVAGSLADRGNVPIAELEKYFSNQSHDAEARYWVFQLLTQADRAEQAARLEQMLDDPGPELKYLAVEHYLKKLDAMRDSADSTTQIALLTKLLESSRHPAQIQTIAGLLKERERPVDLTKHFGFLTQWNLIGPFDNRGQMAFDIAYGPEKEIVESAGSPPNLQSEYSGKSGNVRWQEVRTDKEDGTVDLNAVYNNEKGAVCYALTTFQAATAQPCELRLGCTNANQVWLNGVKLISNDVYHTGSAIDQYTGSGELKAGENTILIKICQNEQTESWAQDFAFQVRVTDRTGKAIEPAK